MIPERNLHTVCACPGSPETRRETTSPRTGAGPGPAPSRPCSLGRGRAGESPPSSRYDRADEHAATGTMRGLSRHL